MDHHLSLGGHSRGSGSCNFASELIWPPPPHRLPSTYLGKRATWGEPLLVVSCSLHRWLRPEDVLCRASPAPGATALDGIQVLLFYWGLHNGVLLGLAPPHTQKGRKLGVQSLLQARLGSHTQFLFTSGRLGFWDPQSFRLHNGSVAGQSSVHRMPWGVWAEARSRETARKGSRQLHPGLLICVKCSGAWSAGVGGRGML